MIQTLFFHMNTVLIDEKGHFLIIPNNSVESAQETDEPLPVELVIDVLCVGEAILVHDGNKFHISWAVKSPRTSKVTTYMSVSSESVVGLLKCCFIKEVRLESEFVGLIKSLKE